MEDRGERPPSSPSSPSPSSFSSAVEEPAPSSSTAGMRDRTVRERQKYIWAYGAGISVFSPVATAYQLAQLYKMQVPPAMLLRMSLAILPQQTVLKAVQMNASSPVKDFLNPWAAFAVVGVLQGGVYGQANVHFSNALKLGKVATLRGVFRGSAFAGGRDTISQGIPFMLSDSVRRNVFDRMWVTREDDERGRMVKQWASVLSTSVVSTYLSQGMHNCQITMQADQSLGYGSAVRQVWREHGVRMFFRGGEARVGLLLVVNVLNELLLKKAWSKVET
jgi:hypothetical protein